MLYTKLKKIYQQNRLLELNYKFEKYYPLLNQFLISEIKDNSKFINPYRFAFINGLLIDEVIRYFLALSIENGIFQVRHKFTCLECGDINILDKYDLEEDEIICEECGVEELTKKVINQDNLTFLFELTPDLSADIKEKLSKINPSSNDSGEMEEGGVKASEVKRIAKDSPEMLEDVINQIDFLKELVKGTG